MVIKTTTPQEREQLGITNAPLLSNIDSRVKYTDAELVTLKNEVGVKGIPPNESKITAGASADPASTKTFHGLQQVITSNINDLNKHGVFPWDKALAEAGRYSESIVVLDSNGILKQLKTGGNVIVDPSYDDGTNWDTIGKEADNDSKYLSFDDNSILGLRKAGEILHYSDIRAIPIFNTDGLFYNGLNIQLLPQTTSQEVLTPRNHTGMLAVVNGCNGVMRSKVTVNTDQGADFNLILYFTSNDTEITSYISLADLTTPRTYIENTDLTVGAFLTRIGVTDLEFKSHWKLKSTDTYNGIINENGFNDYNQDLLTNRTVMADYEINTENTKISYANNFDSITQKETSLTDATHIGRRTRLAYLNGNIAYFIEYWSVADQQWISKSSGVVLSSNITEWNQADYDDDKYTIFTLFKIPSGIAMALNLVSLATDPVNDDGTHYNKMMDEKYLAANFLTETAGDARYTTAANVENTYLKKADASTTYLTSASADAKYRSKIEPLQTSAYADNSVTDSKLTSTFLKGDAVLSTNNYGDNTVSNDKLLNINGVSKGYIRYTHVGITSDFQTKRVTNDTDTGVPLTFEVVFKRVVGSEVWHQVTCVYNSGVEIQHSLNFYDTDGIDFVYWTKSFFLNPGESIYFKTLAVTHIDRCSVYSHGQVTVEG